MPGPSWAPQDPTAKCWFLDAARTLLSVSFHSAYRLSSGPAALRGSRLASRASVQASETLPPPPPAFIWGTSFAQPSLLTRGNGAEATLFSFLSFYVSGLPATQVLSTPSRPTAAALPHARAMTLPSRPGFQPPPRAHFPSLLGSHCGSATRPPGHIGPCFVPLLAKLTPTRVLRFGSDSPSWLTLPLAALSLATILSALRPPGILPAGLPASGAMASQVTEQARGDRHDNSATTGELNNVFLSKEDTRPLDSNEE